MGSKIKGAPPTVAVGKGGPPAPVLATDLRARQSKLLDEALVVAAEIKKAKAAGKDHEDLSNKAHALRAEAHKLTVQINAMETDATRH